MNRQHVYDTVKAHLLEQRKRATEFRAADGSKSVYGSLLTDATVDKYAAHLERGKPHDVGALLSSLLDCRVYADVVFIRELRAMHDARPIAEWRAALEEFATKWGVIK